MKLTIDRDPLFKAVSRAAGVVPGRTTIPILGNVRLDATAEGQLSITATDLDVETTATTPATVTQAGSLTVPATKLVDLVRNLPTGGEITLAYDRAKADQRLSLACGRTRANLPTLPAEDFPTFAADRAKAGGAIHAAQLLRLLNKTRFAVSNEETRYYLNGTYLHVRQAEGETVLRAVATDGMRLGWADMPAPEGFADFPGIIIPTKTLDEVRKLLEGEGEVELRASESKLALHMELDRIVSKVIDGHFPDYQRVVPEPIATPLQVDKGVLTAGLKRCMVLADDKSRSLKLSLSADRLQLTSRSAEAGQIDEELEADYAGPDLVLGVNGKFLADLIGQIGGDILELHPSDPASPILALDPADKRLRFVLMPLRV